MALRPIYEGGLMNLSDDEESGDSDGEGAGVGSPPRGGYRTARGKEEVVLRSIARNNKGRSLVPERSLYEFGTSTPHDLDTPHGLVSRKTTTRDDENRSQG